MLTKALPLKRFQQKRLNRDVLEASGAFCLPAVNPYARIKWGRIFIREVFRFFDMSDDQMHPHELAYFVTLVDGDLVTTAAPQKINVQGIRRKLGGRLRGINYIGMIEPAYYGNVFGIHGDGIKDLVSWHGHFLVWGLDQRKIADHVKGINCRCHGIMPYLDAAHQKQIEYGQFGYKLWYIVKSPCKEYSIGKLSKPDKRTGATKFRHNKRDIRPGTRVKLFYLMRPLYLDQLAMAGGKGRALLNCIKTAALRDYREQYGWSEKRP